VNMTRNSNNSDAPSHGAFGFTVHWISSAVGLALLVKVLLIPFQSRETYFFTRRAREKVEGKNSCLEMLVCVRNLRKGN
jgi:hypothetical protein